MFIRFETEDGIGMYQAPGFYFGLRSAFPESASKHPTIYEDKILESRFAIQSQPLSFWKFGFNGWDQLSRWIYDAGMIKIMKNNKIQCHIYRGEILVGDMQSIILQRTMKHVRRIYLTEVLRELKN